MASELRMNGEYRELLSLFAKYRVRYLVVGAYAVMRYTEPRYTKDLDVWVDSGPGNAKRVFRAVAEFGAPLKGYGPELFLDRYGVFQIGVSPIRIDILSSIRGVRFSSAWEKRATTRIEGQAIHFISKQHLIKAKKAAGRLMDLIDIENLMGRT
ncbi:MAG: hypothetical protein JO099_10230 [Acidobacteriia bacterium]|nr:hypothetical protein [Terriglobia bacterium]